MDKELKKKWIDALRSGKYRQGTGRLIRTGISENEYCCLGVLCSVMGMEEEGDVFRDKTTHLGYETALAELAEQLGLEKKVSLKGVQTDLQDKLINMNDSLGWNFEKIANYLERINL